MTFGYSRDDVGKFLPIYLSKGILQADPFEVTRLTATPSIFTFQFRCSQHKNIVRIRSWRPACRFSQVLDQRGVGQLIKIATERGRAARPNLKVGNLFTHDNSVECTPLVFNNVPSAFYGS